MTLGLYCIKNLTTHIADSRLRGNDGQGEKSGSQQSLKLCESAEKRFRRIHGFKQLQDVINGEKFIDGIKAGNNNGFKISLFLEVPLIKI